MLHDAACTPIGAVGFLQKWRHPYRDAWHTTEPRTPRLALRRDEGLYGVPCSSICCCLVLVTRLAPAGQARVLSLTSCGLHSAVRLVWCITLTRIPF